MLPGDGITHQRIQPVDLGEQVAALLVQSPLALQHFAQAIFPGAGKQGIGAVQDIQGIDA